VPAGSDQAYVLVDGVASRTLFDTVIDRSRLPDDVASGDAAAAPSAEAQAVAAPAPAAPAEQPLTAAPAGITVDVLNGTGTTGLAAQVGDQLRAQGFGVGTLGNEAGTVNQTLVRYGPGVAEQARTVAAAVPGSVLQPSDATGDAVQLVIGPGFAGVVPVTLGAPAADTPAADASAAASATAEPTATAPACS
jgi:hypothetical protein